MAYMCGMNGGDKNCQCDFCKYMRGRKSMNRNPAGSGGLYCKCGYQLKAIWYFCPKCGEKV